MYSEERHRRYTDIRMTIYSIGKQLVLILVIGFIIKYTLCDTVVIKTDQMEPSILSGDRIIISKAPVVPPFRWFSKLRHTHPVIFMHPHSVNKPGCLRIAGIPGDTVMVKEGTFSVTNNPALSFPEKHPEEETLPPDYSPRDTMDPFWIPQKGDTISLDSLSIRDVIFVYSMIQQENPQKEFSLQPSLFIDDSLSNDYFIKDFPLFTGTFNAIPESLAVNWFFWDRLKAFLKASHDEHAITLTFSIFENQSVIERYCIRKKFYFLLADNWCKGFDSRYFGPVASPMIRGRVVSVLWSFSPEKRGITGLRKRRIFKIIK